MESILASLVICTYNQEDYVAETIEGALNQTYSPLEILIFDDASTDNTWDVIVKMVDGYLQHGCVHTVILNRNSHNLGIMGNNQLAMAKAKGEIMIACGGDDICMPNRVSRIVEEWIKADKSALSIYHGAWKIDSGGRHVGELGDFYFNEGTLGAVAAYSRELLTIYGPVAERGAVEDEVYGNRALILGRRLNIHENLLKYRVGVGVSSGYRDYRRKQIRVLGVFKLCSIRQSYRDLEKVRGFITPERYQVMYDRFHKQEKEMREWLTLWEGKTFKERYSSFRRVMGDCNKKRLIIAIVLLFPRRVGDLLFLIMNHCVSIYDRISHLKRSRLS